MKPGTSSVFATVLIAAFVGACLPDPAAPELKPTRYREFASSIKRRPVANLELHVPGPFPYRLRENYQVSLSPTESLLVDLVVPENAGKSPLVIFAHGNHSHKEAHRYQAAHLASWGMHTMVVQLPNHKQWRRNGKRLLYLSKLAHSWPRIVSPRVDPKRIILVGHSFGGSAATIAVGLGAPARGLVLLDPAVVHKSVRSHLRNITIPIAILGADRRRYRSRRRSHFYKYPRGETCEISVLGATHDDAQYPSMYSLFAFGADPFTETSKQKEFLAALTASALSIDIYNGLKLAKRHFAERVASGQLKNFKHRYAAGSRRRK